MTSIMWPLQSCAGRAIRGGMRHRLLPVFTFLLLPLLLSATAGCDDGGEEAAPEPEAAEQAAPQADEPTPAADEPPEPEGPPNPLGLPDDLSAALRREMLALEPAMGELSSHLARGSRDEAAATAMRIHDSFILKQELSEEQLHTLVSSLPEGFVHRDRAFHQGAAKLAHAAEAGEMAEAARLYGEMATACVACHAEHASSRFPGLEGVTVPPPEPPAHGEEGAAHAH